MQRSTTKLLFQTCRNSSYSWPSRRLICKNCRRSMQIEFVKSSYTIFVHCLSQSAQIVLYLDDCVFGSALFKFHCDLSLIDHKKRHACWAHLKNRPKSSIPIQLLGCVIRREIMVLESLTSIIQHIVMFGLCSSAAEPYLYKKMEFALLSKLA